MNTDLWVIKIMECLILPKLWVKDFPGGSVVKISPAHAGDAGDMGLIPGSGRSPEDGWSSMVGCSPWGREESDMTERLHFT